MLMHTAEWGLDSEVSGQHTDAVAFVNISNAKESPACSSPILLCLRLSGQLGPESHCKQLSGQRQPPAAYSAHSAALTVCSRSPAMIVAAREQISLDAPIQKPPRVRMNELHNYTSHKTAF